MSVSDDTSVLATYIHTSGGYMTFKYTEQANTKLVVNQVFMMSTWYSILPIVAYRLVNNYVKFQSKVLFSLAQQNGISNIVVYLANISILILWKQLNCWGKNDL